jgi:hypothetical protein
MNTNRDYNPCVEVRCREAAVYFGERVENYGYGTNISNCTDAAMHGYAEPVLVMMHPQNHNAYDHTTRVVPQEVPSPPSTMTTTSLTTSSLSSEQQKTLPLSIARLKATIEALLGSTPTSLDEVEVIKAERFEASSQKKFRGVTKHKRTQRFEAHIWESKKQIYLGGFESELLAARSHDIMALKCKGLDWGALNFPRADYSEVIEVLGCVQKEDIIYCLREFSKLFGELGGVSGSVGGSSCATHASHTSHAASKGAHALRPALKIRKHADHGQHHQGHALPRTPNTPFNCNRSGPAPITPKEEKAVLGTALEALAHSAPVEEHDDVLFDPVQPVDDLCQHGVFLPQNTNVTEGKAQDPFSIFYDSLESSGCMGEERLGSLPTGVEDLLDNAWQWSHC